MNGETFYFCRGNSVSNLNEIFVQLFLVKRLRREKGATDEINVSTESPGPSLLGKRVHVSSQSESENEPIIEIDHCSRTL